MAIFHLHVKNISRRDGRSVVAAAAYRAGATLPNEIEEGLSAFGGRRDVVFTEIRLPFGAPEWMEDRAQLWNAVEAAEKRKDARLAKEVEFALPRELLLHEWIALTRDMADAYASQGHVVDLAIHADATRENPHAHLLLTTRSIKADGFGGKMREADGRAFVADARRRWETLANGALVKAGIGGRIDARSHAARGLEAKPTVHRGPDREERQARRERAEAARSPSMEDILASIQQILEPTPMERPMADQRPTREQQLEARNQELEREVTALRAELQALRRAEERSLPDLDPAGTMVTRGDIEDAQDRMIAQMEKSPRENPQTPRPERMAPGREAGRADDLAWLRTAGPSSDRNPGATPRDRDLDWLRTDDREQEMAPNPERDRER